MAKKRPLFGVANYVKRTPKKRPGRHAKKYSKRTPSRKKYRGQGRQFRIILMKPIIITLLYLTFGGEIKQDTFEINVSCSCTCKAVQPAETDADGVRPTQRSSAPNVANETSRRMTSWIEYHAP